MSPGSDRNAMVDNLEFATAVKAPVAPPPDQLLRCHQVGDKLQAVALRPAAMANRPCEPRTLLPIASLLGQDQFAVKLVPATVVGLPALTALRPVTALFRPVMGHLG
jgi:hypothetical protein